MLKSVKSSMVRKMKLNVGNYILCINIFLKALFSLLMLILFLSRFKYFEDIVFYHEREN